MEKLIALEMDARAYGFDWTDHDMIIEQAISECEEIREALHVGETPARVQEEIGDLLHTALSLCIFAGFDVGATVDMATEKFARRMRLLKQVTKQHGLEDLRGQSMDYMLQLWREVKELEAKNTIDTE